MPSRIFTIPALLIAGLWGAACLAPGPAASPSEPAVALQEAVKEEDAQVHEEEQGHEQEQAHEAVAAELPRFAAAGLAAGEKIRVVATTNIVADVVKRVGGDSLDLFAMLPVGADPHSYQPTPQDLRALADAHIVFVNGLGLEEGMSTVLADFVDKTVSVNTGVETIEFGASSQPPEHEDEEEEIHLHEGADPHTWFSVPNVEVWTHNVAQVLSDLDPANAAAYEAAALVYSDELDALQAELVAAVAQLPAEQRKLVADHGALGYLAHGYGFEMVGSVIPGFSTLAEPSAQELAALQDQVQAQGIRAILVGTTVSQRLERQLAEDLGIAVLPIYTGSLSEEGGPAASYVEFMRYNIHAIVAALQ